MKKFNEIKYARPDFETIQNNYDSYASRIENAKNFEEIVGVIEDERNLSSSYGQMSTIAFIRCYQDCSDEFYLAEMQECQKGLELINRNAYNDALLVTSYAENINDKYGKMYLNEVKRDIILTEKGKDERIAEAMLVSEYQNLKATLKFEFDGKSMSEGELIPHLSDANRDTRKKALIARYEGYLSHKDEFNSLLSKLIEARLNIAKACGFQSYLDYMNIEKGRTTYGEKELAAFTAQVKKDIVPLLDKIRDFKKKNLQLNEIMEWDERMYFKDGNAKPAGDIKYLLENAGKMYYGLNDQLGKLYDLMIEFDNIDVYPSVNKISGMGFCTNLAIDKVPFIFANSNGTNSDVDVFTHEFGHAYQQYLSAVNQPLNEYVDMPNDIVEIPSKSMEQFAYKHAEVFFKDDADKYRKSHILGVIEEICSFCAIHEIETYLYNNPNASQQDRIDSHYRILKEFNPNINSGDLEKYHKEGAPMFTNMGVYMFPRYLISYALSDVCAIEFKSQLDDNEQEALENYTTFCSTGGSLPFDEILKKANLSKAYEVESVKKTAAYLKTIL